MKLVVKSEPRADGQLSVVEAADDYCVLSNGDELIVRWGKLADLCRELAQEQASVSIRAWAARDGVELVEIHRVLPGAMFTSVKRTDYGPGVF